MSSKSRSPVLQKLEVRADMWTGMVVVDSLITQQMALYPERGAWSVDPLFTRSIFFVCYVLDTPDVQASI